MSLSKELKYLYFFLQIQFVSSWPHAVRTVPPNHQPPSLGKPVRIRRTQSPAIQARLELENMADVYTWHHSHWCEYNFVEELKIMICKTLNLKKKNNQQSRQITHVTKSHKFFITKLLLIVLDRGMLTEYMHVFDL